MRLGLLIVTSVLSWAQAPVPTLPGPPPAEGTGAPAKAETKPSRPRIENAGKPMQVPVACGEEEMHAFGLSCPADEPCPVYLELTDVEPVGSKLFITGNLHTSSATLTSILLASDDAGKSWTEPFERIRSGILDQIQFMDFETGWIGGQIIKTLPRDPFILLTTDGGNSWRQKPIYDESRVASVERFWFESRTKGVLILDRRQAGEAGVAHERLESMTGGESWNVREVSSKPITLKLPPARQTGWRVRADGGSKAYRVERRQGERWVSVASFLVHAGDCKEAERTLAEPPPEPAAAEPEPEVKAPAPAPLPKPAAPRKKPTLERRAP